MTVPALAAEDHSCPGCGVSYLDLTTATALEAIARVPARVRAAIDSVPASQRRTRRCPHRWSVTEYAVHLRDVYAVSTIRLHRIRAEHRPVLEPMLNDLRVRRFRYNELDLTAVLAELTRNVDGLQEEAGRLAPWDWSRVATRLPGETRSALWLLRQAAHEGHHHILDISACR